MPAPITQDTYGETKDGQDVTRFTLSSLSGHVVVRVINYGCVVTEILVRDRQGKVADVTLGYDNLQAYEENAQCFGGVIGRAAGRINKGQFLLDGQTVTLDRNDWTSDCKHHLHGGAEGFHKRVWDARVEGESLVLSRASPDGHMGYPGRLAMTVTLTVTDDGQLAYRYQADTTRLTVVNVTNHVYFNLKGHDAGSLDGHLLTVHGDAVCLVDQEFIPTGEFGDVSGTAWDFRRAAALDAERNGRIPGGRGINETYRLVRPPGGHGKPQLAVRLEDEGSGRVLEVLTTEPAVQMYTSYFLDEPRGKAGAQYARYGAVCMECQKYPDSPNHESWPSTVLKPGEKYDQTTIYKFSIK